MPAGFHIYRVADPTLTGGSYDLAFDGEGRLLVGDGNAVRRLSDVNRDGVYDQFEVIATGLGGRGPQGLLVWGDRMYAVGGDGLQLFDGYRSGKPVHRGRLGAKFNTGGDHDLHTVLRGFDGYLYLMAGNGAGVSGRQHITETNSPMLIEREASVFRLDADGRRWECLASGGRNPPGLGLHPSGDLFSFDSDMEWHVGLPWYREIRLNHWAVGTDQGWQDFGAFPAYYIDGVAPVLEAGRGSPNWGVFYEHRQWPARFLHAFLNCDYRWKGASDNEYSTSGRLVAFFLKPDGAEWRARMETIVKPKPGARDSRNRPIDFALVDVEVGPDGSVFVSDHNQGIWRIFFDDRPSEPRLPAIQPGRPPVPATPAAILADLLQMPQPLSEWSRVQEERLGAAGGEALTNLLRETALNAGQVADSRVRAIQLLAPGFASLGAGWLKRLAADARPEIRAQAAWLLGLRASGPASAAVTNADTPLLLQLLADEHPLVRRRAAESLTRSNDPSVIPELVARLNDSSRLTRFIGMTALAHHPADRWFDRAAHSPNPQTRLRALVACLMRKEPATDDHVRAILRPMLLPGRSPVSAEDLLDLLRVLALFEKSLSNDPATRSQVEQFVLATFPESAVAIRWEQARLIGLYKMERAFGRMTQWLRSERDPVTQFHIAHALARLPGGWTPEDEAAAILWFESTQLGWFADLASKGVEFPQQWATTVTEFAGRHSEALLQRANTLDPTSPLGLAVIDLIARKDPSGARLIELYRAHTRPESKTRIADAFRRTSHASIAAFLREELNGKPAPGVRGALLRGLAAQPADPVNIPWLTDGLRDTETDVARALAAKLVEHRPAMTREFAQICLERLGASARLVHPIERLLVTVTGRQRPGYSPNADLNRRAEDPVQSAALTFWQGWFREQFGPVSPTPGVSQRELSDDAIHRFILGGTSRGGDARRGGVVYDRLQCYTCHGGSATPGREDRLFGPDLIGATRRLTRTELADALAFPSRQVADRFKAFELEKKDGTLLSGFVTDQSEEAVTIATPQSIERVPRNEVARLAPQALSLMPDRLLNRLTDDELRDLIAYLDDLGQAPGK